jgi:hypothetical protein
MIAKLVSIVRVSILFLLFALSVATINPEARADSSSNNLKFSYAFVASTKSGKNVQFVAVESKHTLKSGDFLKFYMESLSDLYFYLFHLSPNGALTQIFPESNQTAKIPTNRKVNIPAGKNWIELDSNTGIEKFFLIASKIRQDRLEKLYKHYLTSEKDSTPRSEEKILDEINHIRQRNLSTIAERPIRIGGSFRDPESNISQSDLDASNLGFEVDTNDIYSRIFSIDHQ